jgi:23S rRNA-intervening sequence protein
MAFRFEGLEIFELAIDFARVVYEITRQFPREEMFGLTANLRRAATSVALNIAEGAGRGTKRDFAHFIDVAAGPSSKWLPASDLPNGWVSSTPFIYAASMDKPKLSRAS